jgi:filamentous hemagglutinin family protein
MAMLGKLSFAFVATCFVAAAVPRLAAAQNITVDGRFSPARTLVGPNYSIGANLGRQVGSNLFHSFGQFGLATGESATFTPTGSTSTINNVIGRVTGGAQSSINGRIASAIFRANLYLINPSGIVFGPNAAVNVSGSFHASTADYIKMSDGAKFQATNPEASTFSAAPPTAFGFLTTRPAALIVNSTLGIPAPISVTPAGTLGLVAGPVSITAASLTSGAPPPPPPGTPPPPVLPGTIHVVDPRNTPALTVTSFGPVVINRGSALGASRLGGPGVSPSVFIRAGALTIDASTVVANNSGSGPGGSVAVTAGQLTVTNGGLIGVGNFGTGIGGSISLSVAGQLRIDGSRILSDVAIVNGLPMQGGTPGDITVTAGTLSIANGGAISAATLASSNGGSVFINVAGQLTIAGTSSITSESTSTGNAGNVAVNAGILTILSNGVISGATFGAGNGGSVTVRIAGGLSIDCSNGNGAFPTGITSNASAGSTGNAGSVSVSAGTDELLLDGRGFGNTQIAASATGPRSGPAGWVAVAANARTVRGGAQIASTTAGPGKGGDIAVTVANGVTLSGSGPNGASGISAAALPGSSGRAGGIILISGGAIALSGGAKASSSTAGVGSGGSVRVTAGGLLSLTDPGSGIIASATSAASGDAGSVRVTAPQIALMRGAEISSTTAGTGMGGSVSVMTPGALVLDGAGVANTQIAASAAGRQSRQGGSVTVGADTLMIEGGAQIASSTAGPGKGGDIAVTVANGVTLSGSGPNGASGISAAALPGSSGAAGEVVLTAGGAIALSGGAKASSSTAGAGNSGTVQVTAQGPLTLSGPGTGITAAATPTARGNAGLVRVAASQVALTGGAEISSTTAGIGAGGSVNVTTPGMLVLDGAGVPNTQIAASATGAQSGPGGSVTVSANHLTVEGGAQIASSTAGPGKGGEVNAIVATDIVLRDLGPQITALSTGNGDAGSITVSAVRLLMNNGAAISTEAVGVRSAASGGNIALRVRDFLYLVSSEITAAVKGKTGYGGNMAIDSQLVVLNHSSIRAEAIKGRGGNITINGKLIASTDSIVSATGQLVFSGPLVDVNGALVVLSSELRSAAEVLRDSCAAQSGRPQSSLVEAGRGGLPQDPEATLPALYIAGRDVNPNAHSGAGTTEADGAALQTTVHLTMRCG